MLDTDSNTSNRGEKLDQTRLHRRARLDVEILRALAQIIAQLLRRIHAHCRVIHSSFPFYREVNETRNDRFASVREQRACGSFFLFPYLVSSYSSSILLYSLRREKLYPCNCVACSCVTKVSKERMGFENWNWLRIISTIGNIFLFYIWMEIYFQSVCDEVWFYDFL